MIETLTTYLLKTIKTFEFIIDLDLLDDNIDLKIVTDYDFARLR